LVLIAVVLAAALARLLVSGIFTGSGLPINVSENFEPLFRLLVDGREIDALGPRQYGVVAFLIFDPVIRIFGRNESAINLWGLLVGLLCLGTAFASMVRRFGIHGRNVALLGILWAGFLPVVLALALRHFDMFVLGFLAAGLFFYTGSVSQRTWTGVMIAAGFLTKLLPGVFLPVLLVREPRAFAFGMLAIALLLSIGQVMYGTLMGLGYLPFLATSGVETSYVFSLHNENNSLRGLLYKAASGFHVGAGAHLAEPANAQLLNYVAFGVELGLLGYLLYVVFRYRRTEGLERRSAEFALALVTMYLIAPQTSHEHMVSMILAYTVLGWLWLTRSSVLSMRLIVITAVSLLLVGVYLPLSLVAAVVPLEDITRRLGNEAAAFSGSPAGTYDFLGFPGYGLILGWVVLVIVERRSRSTSDASAHFRTRTTH
jgi:hypothetical protein